MNTAPVILRALIVSWSLVLLVVAVLVVLALLERWLDRNNDWTLWEDDLEDSNVISLPVPQVLYDAAKDGL